MITSAQIRANRRKALEALRSGEYQQGTGVYYNSKTNCHCAMGVMGRAFDSFDRGYLSGHVAEQLGEDRRLGPNKLFTEVTAWNDHDGLTFPEIADKLAERWGLE